MNPTSRLWFSRYWDCPAVILAGRNSLLSRCSSNLQIGIHQSLINITTPATLVGYRQLTQPPPVSRFQVFSNRSSVTPGSHRPPPRPPAAICWASVAALNRRFHASWRPPKFNRILHTEQIPVTSKWVIPLTRQVAPAGVKIQFSPRILGWNDAWPSPALRWVT